MDAPSGDAQILSKARACLNQGDFPCAKTHYQKLSSNLADIAASEQAFAVIEQYGITIGVFFKAIVGMSGTGGFGNAISIISTAISENAATTYRPGEAARIAIFDAYQLHLSITEPNLKAFVKFLTSMALSAELLAEDSATGTPTAEDLVNNPTACRAATLDIETGCSENCKKTGSILAYDGADIDMDSTATDISGTASLQMVSAALTAFTNAASGISGDDSSSAAGAASESTGDLAALNAATEGSCFRKTLLTALF